MLKGGDGRTPTGDADVWEAGKGSGDPTEESPAFQHPSHSGEKPVPVWACRLGLELTWTSSAPPAQSSGLGFGSSFSPTKHKFSLCVRTVLNYLASAFLPIHNSTGSCSEYFPISGTWFWRSFFVCLFTGLIWRHDIICQTRRWRQRVLNFHSGETQVQMLSLLWQILQEIKSTKINTALEQTHQTTATWSNVYCNLFFLTGASDVEEPMTEVTSVKWAL